MRYLLLTLLLISGSTYADNNIGVERSQSSKEDSMMVRANHMIITFTTTQKCIVNIELPESLSTELFTEMMLFKRQECLPVPITESNIKYLITR